MDRNTLQEQAAKRLDLTHRLICQWATGVGKSSVLLKFLRDHPGMDCLILVPEQNNIQNWMDEFTKFGVPMELVRIACYASLHKYENTAWDVVCYDEAPHFDTEKRKAICRSIRAKYVLALGAVIDKDETEALESVYGHFERSWVSFSKAIEWGILPPPEVHIIHMQLDDSKRIHWYKGSQYTDKGYYDLLEGKVKKTVSEYDAHPNAFTKNRMLQAGNARKKFLGLLKDEAALIVRHELELMNKRFLCFCSSIKQAEMLGGEYAFTSKTPMSMRLLERFNNHEIDQLYVVGKLIEGQNLNDIECGVIVQLGGTSRITVQEAGRIMRAQKPVIYIPVFDGTQDDKFLYTVTSNISEQYIKHVNL